MYIAVYSEARFTLGKLMKPRNHNLPILGNWYLGTKWYKIPPLKGLLEVYYDPIGTYTPSSQYVPVLV